MSQIRQLEDQLDVKRKELAETRNIVAPIRRLPFELLSQIFYEYCILPGNHKSTKPQILISQVCSTFRTVARASPRLWTRLDILIGKKGFPGLSDMVSDWLGRSGSLPLDVSILDKSMDSFAFPQDLPSRLIPFCNRLQFLKLVISIRVLASILDQLSFPALTNLDLAFRQIAAVPPILRRFTALLDAPRLNSVTLRRDLGSQSPASEIILDMLPLPVKQLQYIHLKLRDDDSLNPRSYLDVLHSCCHTLVECRLRCPAWPRSDSSSPLSPITFHTLKLLSLEQWEDESESRFIQLITVPSLVTLCIDHSKYGGDDPSDISEHLIDLQTRSSAPLLTLELIRVRMMSAHDILDVLAVFPTLKHLELWNCNLNTNALMRGLELRKCRRCLVLGLESLRLVDYEVIPRYSNRSIVDMVESRTGSGEGGPKGCLEALTLSFEKHDLDEELDRLDELLDFEFLDDHSSEWLDD
ncbi:hypothetical protein GYMLUDRAFT_43143 [Collybiopsis luxurians FD-317 M1]|uniref:F-box domain-containing protein n=1 Tax=Collybiopsis luxurians FD-317 M1 TaxID=944289 RepID=A0A0D0BBE6_9AGAR|nr:hypothetical protein GYMLUDRAFT_43143 [Collybiopsis luxurians FD-317 M1]